MKQQIEWLDLTMHIVGCTNGDHFRRQIIHTSEIQRIDKMDNGYAAILFRGAKSYRETATSYQSIVDILCLRSKEEE